VFVEKGETWREPHWYPAERLAGNRWMLMGLTLIVISFGEIIFYFLWDKDVGRAFKRWLKPN
jgi:hypothetical protein